MLSSAGFGGGSNETGNKDTEKADATEKFSQPRLTSLEKDSQPLDSNRPREEWNISHVKAEENIVFDTAETNQANREFVETQEEEMKAFASELRTGIDEKSFSE